MKRNHIFLFLLSFALLSCVEKHSSKETFTISDSLILAQMVKDRVEAMQDKDLSKVMSQFNEDATYINSAGILFENKKAIEMFHQNMMQNDSLSYQYHAGKTHIRIISADCAVVYYSWEIIWTFTDTIKKPIPENGLMTLTAKKTNENWHWVAVSNQHTNEFIEDVFLKKGK